jgi:hypothetical protein
MATWIPTPVGDVLILHTSSTFSVYAVGVITEDGQQGFNANMAVGHLSDRAAAVTRATRLRQSRRRIFFQNIDTHEWAEL